MATETITEQATQEIHGLADKDADSTNSEIRYMAYGARLRTALRASTRYVAYTSDVGEAFRPMVPPWMVTAAYGVSWLYLIGDVGFETWKAKRRGSSPIEVANYSEPTRLGLVAVKRGVFQAVASMALPAFTIHNIVRQSKRAFVNARSTRMKTWGPTMTGLAVIPLLPYLFDHPVETVTDRGFEWIERRLMTSSKNKNREL